MYKALSIVLITFLSAIGHAETNNWVQTLQDSSKHKTSDSEEVISYTKDVDEVSVESFFFEQKITSSASPIGVVTNRDLQNIPIQTIGDALKLEPSIAIKSDGTWATAPSIRGLSGQRVIVAVDGNRIETATDVNGGMTMINLNDVSQIDIIKSGASSLYGSGAIGGVINFVTQPITYTSTPEFHAMLSSSLQSVNNLWDEYVKFYGSYNKFFYSLSGSYRQAENTMTPAGELINSQFKDYSVNIKAGYRINEQHELRFQHQTFRAKDVGVPGGPFSAAFTVTFPEHSRSMSHLQYHFSDVNEWLKLIKLKAYHQSIYRDVFVETGKPMYAGAPVAIDPTGEHHTFGGLAQADMGFGDYKVTAGIDVWQRNLTSTREKFISLPDSSEKVIGELPLPEASYLSSGMFARAERKFLADKLNTSAGLRYDYIIVENEDVFTPDYITLNGNELNVPKKRHTVIAGTEEKHSWSANIGANYSLTQELNIALSGGHSFRAPNIEELYKYISLADGSVQIGNADLSPEQSNFMDLGIHYKNDKISVSANGFINKINDMIAPENGEWIYDNYGNDGSIVSNDTVSAQILNNISEALLYGFDLSASYEPINDMIVSATMAYTMGKNQTTDGYLPQIAPINGTISVNYNAYEYVQGGVTCEWAGKQSNIAAGETETDGYAIFNLNISSKSFHFDNSHLQAFAGIRNIMDTEYTNHLSTNRGSVTVEPGRNFYIKVRLSL